jgi:ABC-2 type transport system ATP-binding protein
MPREVSMTRPVFEIENVTKTYPCGWLGRGRLTALKNASLKAHAREVIGLVGPNRAGKTTLVKILLSLSAPTSGRGWRFGQPLADRRTLARVGYVHENPAFPRYLSAMELLQLCGALTLMPPAQVRGKAEELLRRVGLADRMREPISRFSKGMIQRLGLAQAVLNDPELLVMDEPAESLDLEGRHLVRSFVRERRDRGGTVLLVSHHLDEVEELCDRIVVLVSGRVAEDRPISELQPRAEKSKAKSLNQVLQPYYASACP